MTVKAMNSKYSWISVVDVMTEDPHTESERAGQADELMSENRFRQLPVVVLHCFLNHLQED